MSDDNKKGGAVSGAQHTPGPWGLERQEYAVVITHQGGSIAATYPEDMMGRKHNALANARLIAAAPDLLAAAQAMIAVGNKTEMTHEDAYEAMFKSSEGWGELAAAIAKATGA